MSTVGVEWDEELVGLLDQGSQPVRLAAREFTNLAVRVVIHQDRTERFDGRERLHFSRQLDRSHANQVRPSIRMCSDEAALASIKVFDPVTVPFSIRDELRRLRAQVEQLGQENRGWGRSLMHPR